MSSSGSKKQRVFPLYLSPIEQFLAADDRPRYPMDFVLDTGFEGVVNREVFETSLREALERHPLLMALVQPAKKGLPCWVLAPDMAPMIDWGPLDKPITLPETEFIDLAKELGLRIWIRIGSERTRIVWQFHHTCTDGIGAYRFLGDLLALYGQRTTTNNLAPELAPIEVDSLKQRKYRVTELAYRNRDKELSRRSLEVAYQVIATRVQPMALPPNAPPGGKTLFPAMEVRLFEREDHERIRAASIELGCTVNDLLLACLFQSLHQWNARHRGSRWGKWFRIMMPTDMRETSDYATPAANMMSYTFIDRRVRDCVDAKSLVAGIRDETALIKHERRGAMFNDAVAGAAQFWSKMLPLVLSGEHCLASVVLSNVGDPTKRFTAKFPRKGGLCVAGNLILDEFTGVPPMRPKTRATISIASFLRRLSISVKCDVHHFPLEATREFLDVFANCIWSTTLEATKNSADRNERKLESGV